MHSDTRPDIRGDLTAHASELGCSLENTMCLSIAYQFHSHRAQKGRGWSKKPLWDSRNLTQGLCAKDTQEP